MLSRLITFRTDSTEITESYKASFNLNSEDIKVIFVKSKKAKRTKEESTLVRQKSKNVVTSILKSSKKGESFRKDKKVSFADTKCSPLAEIIEFNSYKEHYEAPHDEDEKQSPRDNKCKWSCLLI
jgi:hypothetical protein